MPSFPPLISFFRKVHFYYLVSWRQVSVYLFVIPPVLVHCFAIDPLYLLQICICGPQVNARRRQLVWRSDGFCIFFVNIVAHFTAVLTLRRILPICRLVQRVDLLLKSLISPLWSPAPSSVRQSAHVASCCLLAVRIAHDISLIRSICCRIWAR